jgi:alkylated DNA nucleotide flippase Atl1
MSAFKDMLIDIQESLERGVMSFQQIADMYGLPRADVELISKEMMNQFDDSAYDDYAEMEDE